MTHYRRSNQCGGTFFFTVSLANRESDLLIRHIGLLRQAYRRVCRDYPFETVAACVLPEHIHAVWRLPPDDCAYSLRWQLVKRYFSFHFAAAENRSGSKIRHREKGIWQRRFWEHQIRDEADLQRCVDYTHFNPVKHGYVPRVADWEFSTFHRYVKSGMLPENWGGNKTVCDEMQLAEWG